MSDKNLADMSDNNRARWLYVDLSGAGWKETRNAIAQLRTADVAAGRAEALTDVEALLRGIGCWREAKPAVDHLRLLVLPTESAMRPPVCPALQAAGEKRGRLLGAWVGGFAFYAALYLGLYFGISAAIEWMGGNP